MMRMVAIFVAVAMTASVVGESRAQSVEEFYKGRQIELLIGSAPGGGYDVNARLVTRFMGRHIPGNPSFLPRNLDSSATIRVANMVYTISKRDGSVIGAISRSIMTMPLMGVEAVKLDPTKVTWLGSVTNEDSVCVARSDAKVKKWNDMLTKKLIVSTAAPGSSTYTWPVLLQNMFGAKLDIITGYHGGPDTQLAVERGEVEGTCSSLSSLQLQRPEWFKNKFVNSLVLIGLTPNKELPNVPTIAQLAKSADDLKVLKIILAPQIAGRPLIAPPAIPADRKKALQAAFMATMKDPGFLEGAKKLGIEVTPVSGEDIERLVAEVYGSSPNLVAKSREMVELKKK